MDDKQKNFSIIDKGLTIDGTISSKGRLVIKGTLKGTLAGNTVIIAEEGAVFAETKAVSMTVGGTFQGEIHVSEELIILSTGNCSGRVVCNNLVVEAGGLLNAEVTCTLLKNGAKP